MSLGMLDQIEQYLAAKAHGGQPVKVLVKEPVFRVLSSGNTMQISDSVSLGTFQGTVAYAQCARWDPTGKYVAVTIWTNHSANQARVYVYELDEQAETLTLIDSVQVGTSRARTIDWHHSGEYLLATYESAPCFCVISFAGSSLAVVATLTSPANAEAAWCPKSDYILFATTTEPRARLYHFDTAQEVLSQVATLSLDVSPVGPPTWNEAGDRAYITGQRMVDVNLQEETLAQRNLSGHNPTGLIESHWNPLTNLIAHASVTSTFVRLTRYNPQNDTLTLVETFTTSGGCYGVRWNRSGDRLLVSTMPSSGSLRLRVFEVEPNAAGTGAFVTSDYLSIGCGYRMDWHPSGGKWLAIPVHYGGATPALTLVKGVDVGSPQIKMIETSRQRYRPYPYPR